MTYIVTVTEPGSPQITVDGDTISVNVVEQAVQVTVSPLARSFATVAAAADVDMTNAADGSLLVYHSATQTFVAQGTLSELVIDGGSY